MKTSFKTLLFASAMLPVSAFAQDLDTTQPVTPTPPLIQQDGTTAESQPSMGNEAETNVEVMPEGDTAETAPPAGDEAPAVTAEETLPQTGDEAPAVTAEDMAPTGDLANPEMTASADAEIDTFVTVPPTGAWRVADLVGKDVYGIDNEDIGEINDVIVGQTGDVLAVIVGVGGFLGIGEKDVAVSMAALEFGPGMTPEEAAAKADVTTATGETDMAATPAPDAPAMGEPAETGAVTAEDASGEALDVEIGDDALPNRIVLNVTREQLEDAPAFEGIRAAAVTSEEGLVEEVPAPAPAPVQ